MTTRPRLRLVAGAIGWHLVLPALRYRARRRLGALRPGEVTVITVNWNSWEYLEVLIHLVRRRSPPETKILVVDNGSVDESRQKLAERTEFSSVALPANVGHDLALDLGVLLCDTEYAVTLDVDAFPLHNHWLSDLLAPLDTGPRISGARLNREYVHPCCWAMRTARFVDQGYSFRARYTPYEGDREAYGDVGELMSAREAPHLHFFDVTSQRGPGDVGTVFGDLIYHNFYATRFRATNEDVLESVPSAEPERAWAEAMRRYLPGWLPRGSAN